MVDRRGVLDLVASTNFFGFRKTILYVNEDGILPFSTSLRLSVKNSRLNATDIAQSIITLRI